MIGFIELGLVILLIPVVLYGLFIGSFAVLGGVFIGAMGVLVVIKRIWRHEDLRLIVLGILGLLLLASFVH